MAESKPIRILANKTIKRAGIEMNTELYMLELAFTDGTTFSLELWPTKPVIKLNMLPAEDGALPIKIKL